MSEVKSFWCHEASNILCVRASDFDRVTAERDSERRRADVAVADANAADAAGKKVSELLSNRTAERDALQAMLTAADERADVLEGLLREAMPALDLAASAFKSAMPVRSKVRAALKPAGDRNEPNCLRCLDKKTVPSNLAEGYVMDCPDCCGEEG